MAWKSLLTLVLLAVVTLQSFYLGKVDLLTVYLGKLNFLSVTDFSLGNLPKIQLREWNITLALRDNLGSLFR